MTKNIDYKYHAEQYHKALRDEPQLSVRAYCEAVGIPYNSARRYIKRGKSSAELFPTEPKGTKKKEGTAELRMEASNRSDAQKKWRELIKDFLTRAAKNPSLSIKQWSEEKGLVPATVRRQIQKMRAWEEMRSLFDLFDQRLEEYRALARGRKPKSPSNTEPYEKEVAQAAHAPEVRKSGESAQKITFAAHNYAQHHGGYAKSSHIDAQLLKTLTEIDPLSVSNELLLARSRYLRMESVLNKRLASLDEMELNGESLVRDGETVPIEEERMRILFGFSDRLNALAITIKALVEVENKRADSFRDHEHKLLMQPHLLPAEESRLVMDILAKREANGWSAIDTAQKLEVLGARVPPMLLHEAKLEMLSIEPEVEESGVSIEELDKKAKAYREKRVNQTSAWLEQRRQDIANANAEIEAKERGEVIEDAEYTIEGEGYDELATEPATSDFEEGFEPLESE
jgi:hypothetical protein